MSDDRATLRINLIEFPNGLNFIVQLDLAGIYSKRIINSIGTPSNYEINWLCELVRDYSQTKRGSNSCWATGAIIAADAIQPNLLNIIAVLGD